MTLLGTGSVLAALGFVAIFLVPVLIFGVAASNAAIVGPVPFGTPFTLLCAITLMSLVVGPFAAAAARYVAPGGVVWAHDYHLFLLARALRDLSTHHRRRALVLVLSDVADPLSIETSALDPNSPYAASKAAADLIALAAHRTHGQDVLITRCTNNYGPFQFPEKLLPLVIANALEDKPIPVYGDGRQIRDWIYVLDHARGIDTVLRTGRVGQVYNISACEERQNIDVIRQVLGILGKPESLMKHVGDRPAHDRRYALDASKIRRELGWEPSLSFEQGLRKTIAWYLENETWWKKVRGEAYFEFYKANYQTKFEGVQGEAL